MPCFLQAAASSLSGSRPNGDAFMMFQSEAWESNMANPSWCFEVMMMYFMPACFARRTHSSALYFMGLNSLANWRYSATGILPLFMIHSPMPRSEEHTSELQSHSDLV